jgi:hypothetical protein
MQLTVTYDGKNLRISGGDDGNSISLSVPFKGSGVGELRDAVNDALAAYRLAVPQYATVSMSRAPVEVNNRHKPDKGEIFHMDVQPL